MKRYPCAVTSTDVLTAYVTEDEVFKGRPRTFFALVAVNAQGQKVSVLLTAGAAEDLHAQLDDFCFGDQQ